MRQGRGEVGGRRERGEGGGRRRERGEGEGGREGRGKEGEREVGDV